MPNYAWTPILAGDKTIALGDEVKSADVGGKDELAKLKELGVVRDKKYPVPAGINESPVNHRLNQLRAEVEELQTGTDQAYADLAIGSTPEAEVEVEEITK